MSLAELTRNCFQSGISASKWIGLCKLFVAKNHASHDSQAVETALSNSVLALYRSYPGDPDLQTYLKVAIRDRMLSVAVFVATLLQAARSPELHVPATLDMLCRVALDAHYLSGSPPIGSVVPYAESPIVVLGTAQDALALLRTAHSLPMSHFHQLTASASELVVLLLSCVSDMSQVSTAQAMVHFADANDMLQNFQLSSDVRQVLETFVLSLSLLIGDDAKAAREAQMMHSIQLALGKGDIFGSSSDTDIITLSLLLHQLVSYRANEFGSGSGTDPVALLLLLSALTCLSQSFAVSSLIWRSFIVGRLPGLLVLFEKMVNSDNTSNTDWRNAMQLALTSALGRSDLIAHCDHVSTIAGASNVVHDEETPRSFSRDLLQQLLVSGLIDQSFSITMDPMISNDNPSRLESEAQDAGVDLETYIDSKFTLDTGLEDFRGWADRILRDPGSQASFATVTSKRFASLTGSLDVEGLSHLCKMLYSYDAALDIMSLHIKISDLIFQALYFLEEYDCETVGDPQTAVSHLGDVFLFVQYTLLRFKFNTDSFKKGGRTLSAEFLKSTCAVHAVDDLSGDDAVAFIAWFKAIFDSSSEGIEDTILRSTHPKTLLRISATLFSHAIVSLDLKIDRDVLNNGVSYFLGPLLNWTLVGVVKALLGEIRQKGFAAPTHLEILQTLLLSSSCPRPVLSLCGPHVLALLSSKKGQSLTSTNFDAVSIRRTIAAALGTGTGEISRSSPSVGPQTAWQDYPRQAIQDALAMARSGKAPTIDVERCITVTPPSKFLQLLWSELLVAASLGEMDACRRLATFVLTIPRSLNTPPLLPLFMHIILPSLVAATDRQQPPEQTMNLELLVTVISSVLTATLHLEWALRSVSGEHRLVLGESSTAMARRLASDLRARNHSHTSRTVAQRLTSSQTFVANFPVFLGDLGM